MSRHNGITGQTESVYCRLCSANEGKQMTDGRPVHNGYICCHCSYCWPFHNRRGQGKKGPPWGTHPPGRTWAFRVIGRWLASSDWRWLAVCLGCSMNTCDTAYPWLRRSADGQHRNGPDFHIIKPMIWLFVPLILPSMWFILLCGLSLNLTQMTFESRGLNSGNMDTRRTSQVQLQLRFCSRGRSRCIRAPALTTETASQV